MTAVAVVYLMTLAAVLGAVIQAARNKDEAKGRGFTFCYLTMFLAGVVLAIGQL